MNNLQNHWSSQCSHFINRASEFVSFKVLETQFTIYGKSVFVLFFAGIFLPQIQSQVCNQTFDFSAAITVGPSQAPDTWYIDRYAPSSFSSPYNVPGEIVLKHSISTADGAINRPSGQQSSFYNTQGRKYGLSTNTKGVTIDLFIPATWATTDKREAGLWGTAVDISSNITAYPIIEFTSDIAGGGPRFQGWESGSGSFVDMGLPTGFIYDAWYTLEIELLPTGEFLFKVDDLEYTTTTSAPDGSVRIDNVILQGYNYDPTHAGSIETNPGVTYDIFWDNFIDIVPTVQNITTTDLYCSIQAAIDAASDDDVIEISDGAYLENIIIDLPITLQSTNGKLNSSINGDGSTPTILVTSDGVTIDGFTITNVGGANAVYSNNNSDITIQNCRIMDVGSASLSGTPVHALLIEASANTIDNIQILDNMIMALDGGQGGSVSAITIGFSTGNSDVTNLMVDGNMISDIDANTLPFASYPNGGRGAYGILINLGSGAGSGEVLSPQITNNTLSDLEGLWAHGIGMEGNTPGADVSGNDISDLTDHKTPSDAIAVFVEQNSGAGTTSIKNNNFSATSIGVANVTGIEVDARLNWWGDASGPGLIAAGSGVSVSSDVLYCPWLTAPYVAGPPVANNAAAQNLTTGEYFCSIQEAIDDPDTDNGDIIQIAEGTHNERVTVNKELTLQGATSDKTLYILDGTGLVGNGNGITLTSGVSNVTIKDLTIQNYTGANGNSNAGIYGILGNNALLIDNVALMDNTGGSGFYANGPVDGVTIQNSMVINHGPGSRGIVIWNGFKQNITFHNNMIINNNCCGIELQDGTASAVNITDNTIDIGTGDNALGLMGMGMSTGPNLVSGNTITGGGRYGIEVKNPNGGISLLNNNVTLTVQNADLRDRAGIAVFRRSILPGNPDGHPDVPHGVLLMDNTVDGYQQTSGEEGFGIVIEGTDHSISGNTINNCDIGIQFQGGGHANSHYVANDSGDGDQAVGQSPNYFGRGNSPLVCNNDLGSNTFSNNGTDLRLVTATQNTTAATVVMAAAQGQFHNLTQSTYHCSLQDAIDNATADDVIEVLDGAFPENVTIDRPLTVQSANGKLNTSIDGDGNTPTILVTSDGVVIDGLTITNVGGANAVYSNNNSDIIIQNCRIMDVGSASLSGTPVHALLIEASANTIDNIQILDNMIMALDGGQGGSVSAITIGFSTGNFDVTNTIIDGNMISDIDASNLPFASYPAGGRGAYGILINLGSGSGSGEVTSPQITNNTLSDLEGLWTHGIGLEGNTPGADVSGNDISDLTDHKSPSDAIAIFVEDNNGAATTRIKNNNFSSTSIGVANITGVEVDARLNWWSDASGPGLIAEGSGVSVSSDVLYCPWLTAPYVAGPPVTNNASVQNINTGEYFCSIQEAIDHASTSADDVLEILEADYTEPGQIVIDKALTLQGQGKLITTLRPGVNTGSIGNSKAFILVNPGIEFHLQDLTIDGSGVLVYQAIRHQGFGSVDQVAFTEIKYNESGPTYQGVAVAAFGNGDVDVTNSMFTEIGRVGVLYFGGGITNSLFKDNMYTGKGAGDWLDYALDISAGAGVLVEDNSISNNLGVASSDGSTSAGILVSTFFDPGTTADITGNDISGNSTGIFVGFNDSDGSTVTAHMNNITGNTIGVTTTNQPVDATGNWWGDASGPSGEGPGTGDAADPDVDFCGWLLQAYDGNPNPAVGGIPDPKQVTTTIEACSGSDYSFDLDTFFTNMAGDLGQVTYLYDVTVVPDVNVLSPDPRDMGVVSTDGAINNTIVNFGSQSLTVRYSITPTSQYGCVGPEFFVDVVINLDPQVDIIPNGSTSLCAGADRVISGTVVPPGTYTYLWEVIEDPANSGSSTILPANAQSPTLSVASDVTTGNLKIKFTATNNATGCMASDIFDFDVDAFCPVSPCTDLIDLNSAYLANDPHQSEFHAGTKVIADGTITSGNGENISFKAGNEVELRPIFEVEEGAVFTIDIEDCILEKDKPEEIETGEN